MGGYLRDGLLASQANPSWRALTMTCDRSRAELGEDVIDMRLDGCLAHNEVRGNLRRVMQKWEARDDQKRW